MSKPTIAILLGADRVGKSTIVNNTVSKLVQSNIDALSLHFSGAKPHHSSPIDQYIEPLNEYMKIAPEVIVCDRGFSEVCFYDQHRRHIDISHEWAQAAESYFMAKSSVIKVFLVERTWEWSKLHHIEEVKNEYPDASAWWIESQLKAREAEHYAYYNYMNEYLHEHSLLPFTRLTRTPLNFDLVDLITGV
jgi:hypothetical protein